MTTDFLARVGFPEQYASESAYANMDVIETAIDALSEGIGDSRIINMTLSTSSISYLEILDRMKETILRLVTRVLSDLNNYFINNVRLFARYREVIMAGLQRLDHDIVHETFEYPPSKDFPRVIGSSLNEREIQALGDNISSGNFQPGDAAYRADRLLEDFGRRVLGETLDMYDVKTSVKRIVEHRVRGGRTTVTINASTVDRYLRELQDYRGEREALIQLQRNVKEDYEKLKSTYERISKDPKKIAEARRRDLRYLQDPAMEYFNAAESRRFADIHVQVMRLFNGYIDIYNEAYATKLKLLEEKYLDARNLMLQVFRETNAFATINRAAPGATKVVHYDPKLNGMKF